MSTESAHRLLVPVGDSATLRQTVAYVVREMGDRETPDRPAVHFVYPESRNRHDPRLGAEDDPEALLSRVETWVREDADVGEDERLPFDCSTAVVGGDQYLFSPGDYADLLLTYAREHDLDHIVLDPEFTPGSRAPLLTPMSAELSLAEDVSYEEAPVERRVRSRRLLRRRADAETFLLLFGLSYLFYLTIGGFAGTFDYVTGAVSAGIVAAVLSGVTFTNRLQTGRVARVLLRWAVYVPYLFWEIAKANLQVAYIVLAPSLPIDPQMHRFQPSVPRGLPVTTLANSITLTPGTITVDVRNRDFFIHSLTSSAREGLFDGALERGTRFVFFGRQAARIASPRERGQTEESMHVEPDETAAVESEEAES